MKKLNPNEYRLKEITEQIMFYEKYEKSTKVRPPQLDKLIKERNELLIDLGAIEK